MCRRGFCVFTPIADSGSFLACNINVVLLNVLDPGLSIPCKFHGGHVAFIPTAWGAVVAGGCGTSRTKIGKERGATSGGPFAATQCRYSSCGSRASEISRTLAWPSVASSMTFGRKRAEPGGSARDKSWNLLRFNNIRIISRIHGPGVVRSAKGGTSVFRQGQPDGIRQFLVPIVGDTAIWEAEPCFPGVNSG